MVNRSLRFAWVVICLFSGVLSFFLLYSYEAYAPVGPTWHMSMLPGQAASQSSWAQVNAAVESYGADHGVDVARRVADSDAPRSVTHLYVESTAGESFAGSWLANGYHSFNPSMTYRVHPTADSGEVDPAGEYLLSGSEQDVRGLQQVLEQLGYTDNGYQRIATPTMALGLLGSFSLWAAPLTVAVLIVVLVCVGVAMNTRGYAIQRLQGMGPAGSVRLDLSAAGVHVVRVLGVVVAAGAVGIGFFNHFHQFGVWLLLWAVVWTVCAVGAVVVHAVTLTVVWHGPLWQAIKGGTATGWMVTAAYLVRGLALLMVFVVAGLVINDALTASQAQHRYNLWSGATQVGRITVGGGTYSSDGRSDDTKSAHNVGGWERSLNQRGLLLVSFANRNSGGGGQKDLTVDGRPRDVLYVNPAYLGLQNIRDTAGHPVPAPEDPSAVTVLVPDDITGDAQQVLAVIHKTLLFEADLAGTSPADPQLSVTMVPSGRQRFTYNAAEALTYGPAPVTILDDPVIVVLPATTLFLADSTLYAYTTQGSVLAMDTRAVAEDAKTHPELTGDVLGVSPAAQQAAADLAKAHINLTTSILNCVIGLGALIVTTLGLAIVYTRRRGAFIFASRISGWSFWSMFGRFFTIDAVVVLIGAAAVSAGLLGILSSAAPPGGQPTPVIHTMQTLVPIGAAALVILTCAGLARAVIQGANRIIAARSQDVG